MPDIKFYSNVVVPSITEDGYDVVNTQELATILSTASVLSSTNILNGVANQIPYQTSISTTSFIAAPTVTDTFLKWNGSSFTWSSSTNSGVTSVAGRTGDITLTTTDISGYGDFSTVNIPFGSIISTSLQTSTTTANQVLSSLSASTYRSVDYLIQVVSGTDYETTKIILIHDNTDVTYNEYNTLVTNLSLATFDADISGGNIRLLTTPVNASTTYKIVAIATFI